MSNPPEVPASLAGQPIPESLLNTYITVVNTQDADQAAATLLAMAKSAEDGPRFVVYSLRGAMSILFDRQDYDTAARLLAAIKHLSTRLATPWALALYHYSQGQLDEIARNYASAAEHYAEAAKGLEDPRFRASALHTLGLMYLLLGQLAKAENAFYDSIAVATRYDFQLGIAEGYFGLGRIAFSRQNFADAQKYFERSLQEAEQPQTPSPFEQLFPDQVPEQSSMLDTLEDLLQPPYAAQMRAYLSQKSAMQSQIYTLIAQDIIMLGIVAANNADLTLARQTYQQAEEHLMRFKKALPTTVYQRAYSALMANRATLALRSGNLEDARQHADLALEHQSTLTLLEQIENLDVIGRVGTFSGQRNARKQIFIAFQLAEKVHFLEGLLRVGMTLSDNYILEGLYEPAYRVRGVAIDAMERLRVQVGAEADRLRYIQNWTEFYNSIVMLCLLLRHLKQAPHFLRHAFLYAERSRSRAFIDSLGRTLTLPPPPSLPGELLAQEAANLTRIHELENLLRTLINADEQTRLHLAHNEAQVRLEDIWQQIEDLAPEYAALRRGQPATFDDIITMLNI